MSKLYFIAVLFGMICVACNQTPTPQPASSGRVAVETPPPDYPSDPGHCEWICQGARLNITINTQPLYTDAWQRGNSSCTTGNICPFPRTALELENGDIQYMAISCSTRNEVQTKDCVKDDEAE